MAETADIADEEAAGNQRNVAYNVPASGASIDLALILGAVAAFALVGVSLADGRLNRRVLECAALLDRGSGHLRGHNNLVQRPKCWAIGSMFRTIFRRNETRRGRAERVLELGRYRPCARDSRT